MDSDTEKVLPVSPIAALGQRTGTPIAAPPLRGYMPRVLNSVYSRFIVSLVVPQPQETVLVRSNISLERAVNDLAAQLEEQTCLRSSCQQDWLSF